MLSALLSIFLTLLKIIGILLLIIIGIILIILLVPIRYQLEGSSEETERIALKGKVSWLLSILQVKASFLGNELRYYVQVFGKSLITNDPELLKEKEEKKRKKAEKQREKNKKNRERKEKADASQKAKSAKAKDSAKKDKDAKAKDSSESGKKAKKIADKDGQKGEAETKPSAPVSEVSESAVSDDKEAVVTVSDQSVKPSAKKEYNPTPLPSNLDSDEASSQKKDAEESSSEESKKASEEEKPSDQKDKAEKADKADKEKASIGDKLEGLETKLEGLGEKVEGLQTKAEGLQAKYEEYKGLAEEYQIFVLIGIAKTTLIRVLKHILPTRLEGWLHFGFDDPSLTGKVTGLAAALYPVYGKSFDLEPDFQTTVIEGNFKGKGRIRLGFFIWILISLLLKKEIRKLIKFVLKNR